MTVVYRVGADENGLGGQLGPLVVTAVLAEVTEAGTRLLSRRLPKSLAADLNDSKALMSSHDTSLGEAWTRVLFENGGSTGDCSSQDERPRVAQAPADLLKMLLHTPEGALRSECPRESEAQCWSTTADTFEATEEDLGRIRKHKSVLSARGVTLLGVRSEVVCTKRLNANKRAGVHRFMTDLHAMEALLIGHRARVQGPLLAVCGKIGGMGQYGRFFGPLSQELHNVLEEGRAESRYRFPNLGEVRFVRDADAKDPLVMLASIVGKYVRELYMKRISAFYPQEREKVAPDGHPSGYHDPVSERFVALTAKRRRQLGVVDDCFLRLQAEASEGSPKAAGRRAPKAKSETQGSLF